MIEPLFFLKFNVILAEVLAIGRQLLVDQRRQHLLQLKEESFAWGVAVGEHVELNGPGTVPAVSSGADYRGPVPNVLEQLDVLMREQRGRGDGDGLMTSREHSPAVGAAFGNKELFTWLQQVQYWQVVDAALSPLRKAEARQSALDKVAVLHAHQLALAVVIWYLQPWHALTVFPRRQPTPAHNALIQTTFLKKKLACLRQKPRTLEEPFIAASVERSLKSDV